MELKNVVKTEEPLLQRTNITADITFDKVVPSKADLTKQLSSQFKCDANAVVIKKIDTLYGRKEARLDAVFYKDVATKETIEPTTKHMKQAAKKAEEGAKEEAKPEEAKKEEPKKEKAPKEEKAEAPKEEKKGD